MPDRKSLFIGRSGELAVLSEFLSRGYNAATPEIDVGEDVFVIEDGKEGYWPVQVKTATATEQSNGTCTAQYNFRRDQLIATPIVELTYVLALRRNMKWGSFLIIPRAALYERYQLGELGKQNGDQLTWSFTYSDNSVICQNGEFIEFESAWERLWPTLF